MAVLALVGCQKEQFQTGELSGEPQEVTFSVGLPSTGLATKAALDNDGNGAFANRCIMEIYWNDQLYKRAVQTLSAQGEGGKRTAKFTLTVPTDRTYKVAFWADCATADDSAEGFTDKYYTTTDGLTAVAFKGDFVGCDDALDAYYACQEYTVNASTNSFSATLYRPFAQVNVITTDRGEFTLDGMGPDKVEVTFTAPKGMNLLTGALAEAEEITYETSVYKWADTYQYQSKTCATLAMDYIFAPAADGAVIDVNFIASRTAGSESTEYTFSNVPYRRNYRTNIWGALLTQSGKWDVETSPAWTTPELEKKIVAAVVQDIDGLNTFVAANSNADQIDVTFQAQPNDGGNPTEDSSAHSMVTSNLKEEATLNITVASPTESIYVGDYENQNSITLTNEETAHAVVNITVPTGASIQTLVINAPSKSVYLNGQAVGSETILQNVEATTAASTLVIENGQAIGILTIHEGGLEIHGTVNEVVVEQTDGTDNPVKVRTSENLSQSVYAVLADYVDAPQYCWKQNANGTWDVIASPVVIGSATEPTGGFLTISAAAAAAQAGATITLRADIVENTAAIAKDLTLDFNGNTLTGKVSVTAGTVTITGNGTINAPYSAVSADGTNAVVTIKNGTYTADNTGNVTLIHAVNGGTVNIEDGTFTGGKNGSGKEGKVFYAGSNSEQDGNQNNHGTINISGGSFKGRISDSNWGVYNISGGKFDRDEVVHYTNPAAGEGASTSTGTTVSFAEAGLLEAGHIMVSNTDLATKTAYPYAVREIIVTHLAGPEGTQDFSSIGAALAAYNALTTTDNSTYTLTIEPGVYDESNLYICQHTTNVKTIVIKPAGEAGSVIMQPAELGNGECVFCIGTEWSHYTTGGVVIDGIDVDLSSTTHNEDNYIIAYLGCAYNDSNENHRYVHNVTIKNCDFIGTGEDKTTQVVLGSSGSSGTVIDNCTASGIGYFANGQFAQQPSYGYEFGLKVTNCTVNSEKVFINSQNGPHTVIVEGCTVTAKHDYVLRTDGGDLTVTDCNFTSTYQPTGSEKSSELPSVIALRKVAVNATITGCTFTKNEGVYDIFNISAPSVTLNGTENAITKESGYNFPAE